MPKQMLWTGRSPVQITVDEHGRISRIRTASFFFMPSVGVFCLLLKFFWFFSPCESLNVVTESEENPNATSNILCPIFFSLFRLLFRGDHLHHHPWGREKFDRTKQTKQPHGPIAVLQRADSPNTNSWTHSTQKRLTPHVPLAVPTRWPRGEALLPWEGQDQGSRCEARRDRGRTSGLGVRCIPQDQKSVNF